MDVQGFFNSFVGAYVTQAFFHAVIAGTVAEIAIRAWDVRSPAARQRIFLIVIISPVVLFPLYTVLDPGRNSAYFRMETLLESGRWLSLEVLGVHPARIVMLLVFAVTSLVFLVQELIPIARHSLSPGNPRGGRPVAGDVPAVREATEGLPVPIPRIHVLDDDDVLIFSTTGRRASIYLSSGLLRELGPVELRSALAHEIAHVQRSRHSKLVAVYLLRAAMFFNPVVLMEFRRAVQEEEKVCDEIAVSLTGDPDTLARTLRKLYLDSDGDPPADPEKTSRTVREIEEQSHRLNVASRIGLLEKGYEAAPGESWAIPALVLLVVAAINYYVI